MAYGNGAIPLNQLVHLGANFYLPPGTAARWRWMVAEGQRRHGVTFRITPDRDGLGGWNAYRPLDAQRRYKAHYGSKAAAPGYSSHGGVVGGQNVFAIDVDNWQAVSWDNFKRLANDAGFRTDFVSPSERWHIGDFNNGWVIDPRFSGDELGNIDSTKENKQVIKDAIFEFMQGCGPLQPNGQPWPFMASVWNQPIAAQTPDGLAAKDAKGNPIRYQAGGFIASTNSQVDYIKKNGGVSDAQIKVIADAVIAAIGQPTVEIDYAKIAQTVRDKFASDPLK